MTVDTENSGVDASSADHGRSDWLGYWVEFVQKARFKKLACLCHIWVEFVRLVYPCLPGSTLPLNMNLEACNGVV